MAAFKVTHPPRRFGALATALTFAALCLFTGLPSQASARSHPSLSYSIDTVTIGGRVVYKAKKDYSTGKVTVLKGSRHTRSGATASVNGWDLSCAATRREPCYVDEAVAYYDVFHLRLFVLHVWGYWLWYGNVLSAYPPYPLCDPSPGHCEGGYYSNKANFVQNVNVSQDYAHYYNYNGRGPYTGFVSQQRVNWSDCAWIICATDSTSARLYLHWDGSAYYSFS